MYFYLRENFSVACVYDFVFKERAFLGGGECFIAYLKCDEWYALILNSVTQSGYRWMLTPLAYALMPVVSLFVSRTS